MSPLQATTTSDAEFAIENNVSTRASSCRKEREPGAGEAGSAGLEGREASAAGDWYTDVYHMIIHSKTKMNSTATE